MECGNTRNDCFHTNAPKKNIKLKYIIKKNIKTTGIEIQGQHWGGNRQLSMEGIAIECFPISIYSGNNEEKSESHSYISDDNEQDSCDPHAHMFHLLKNFFE